MNPIEIVRRHRAEVDSYGVRRIGIFGSHARGDEDKASDVDVLVEFQEPTFDNFMDLVFYLEGLFSRDVDLVTVDSLSTHIASRVLDEVVWCE